MLLKNLIKNVSGRNKDIFISGISSNSKEIKKNFIFFAIKGKEINGEKFINDAISKVQLSSFVPKNVKLKKRMF